MLSKEATIQISVEHLRALATDDVRVRFSVDEEEDFAYELGVHLGSLISKLFIDDEEEAARCYTGMLDYNGSVLPELSE